MKNNKNPTLFTIPKVLEGPWRLHYPFKSNYLKVSNGLLHYIDEGSGEPILMLHGNPTWSFMFRKLILNFRGSFRCIALDHMGMGLSSRTEETLTLKDRVEDLENLLEKLQINEKINLIGHDWGGTIALGYAVRQPQKVKTLILMNTGLKLPESVKIPLRLKLFQFNPVFTNILAVSLGLFTKGLLRCATVRPIPDDIEEGFLSPYSISAHRKAVGDFIKDIALSRNHPTKTYLEKIEREIPKLKDIPSLLIFGLKDFVFTPEYLYDLKKTLPGSRSLALPRSGHWVLEDEPKKIIDTLKNFLGS